MLFWVVTKFNVGSAIQSTTRECKEPSSWRLYSYKIALVDTVGVRDDRRQYQGRIREALNSFEFLNLTIEVESVTPCVCLYGAGGRAPGGTCSSVDASFVFRLALPAPNSLFLISRSHFLISYFIFPHFLISHFPWHSLFYHHPRLSPPPPGGVWPRD